MTRVCMVAIKFPPYFAGAAVQATYLAKVLKERGVEVEFITDNDERPDTHDVYQGLKVFRFSTYFKKESKLKELVYIYRILRFALENRDRFDVYHFHSMRGLEFMLYPVLTKILKKKVLLKLTLVGSDDPMAFKRRKMGPLFLWGLSFVDRFVAISTQLKKRALESGISGSRVKIIYNGVDTARYAPFKTEEEKNEKKAALGLAKYSKLFLSIGKVEHRKGYDFLIRAWENISAAFPGSALLIGGPGNDESNPYYLALLESLREKGLENVIFLGQIENGEDFMRVSDCFVFCSRSEGFGTVLIEAMAAEVPVVASNIEGVTEDILQDPAIGRICYSQDPEDFANLVIQSLNKQDEEKLKKASAEMRRWFSISYIADQYIKLYQEMLNLPVERDRVALNPLKGMPEKFPERGTN